MVEVLTASTLPEETPMGSSIQQSAAAAAQSDEQESGLQQSQLQAELEEILRSSPLAVEIKLEVVNEVLSDLANGP